MQLKNFVNQRNNLTLLAKGAKTSQLRQRQKANSTQRLIQIQPKGYKQEEIDSQGGDNTDKTEFIKTATSTDFLWNLTREDLKRITKAVRTVKEKKYLRRRVPKYRLPGAKAMKLEDVDKFFSTFLPEEWRIKALFLVQAFLGLRIGEVVQLNIKDIDFQAKQIRIRTEKQGPFAVIDSMFLHEKLESLLLDYISTYETQITKHGGFLFWALNTKCKTPYFSSDRARNVFRRVCERAGLNQTYGVREPYSDLEKWKPGKLYYYTTHSLRYAFAHFLARNNVPIEVAKHLMRHKDISTTQVYYQRPKEEVDTTLAKLFQK